MCKPSSLKRPKHAEPNSSGSVNTFVESGELAPFASSNAVVVAGLKWQYARLRLDGIETSVHLVHLGEVVGARHQRLDGSGRSVVLDIVLLFPELRYAWMNGRGKFRPKTREHAMYERREG